jgi:uracil-DNA glycosylase
MHVNKAQTAFWAEDATGLVGGADRLTAWQPARWPVAPDWQSLVDDFFSSPSGQALGGFVGRRLEAGAVVYPPLPLRALELTPLSEVRVLILGQDPYHGAGQAQGLAFSVPDGQRQPPSLRNIFRELQRDLGTLPPASGSLLRWARQGVLLLNTCLTVEEGQPASHARQGWETLTDAVLAAVSGLPQPAVFMLWGAHAQSKQGLIEGACGQGRHLVLTANHPSPLSALRPPMPFIGCGHFGLANAFLGRQGLAPVDW